MIRSSLLLSCLLLTACADVMQATDRAARETSKTAVNEVIITRFPQVPKELITPFTDCVVENATADEVNALARYAVIGSDEQTATIIRGVLSRPETQQCLSARAPGAAATF
jgi:hypothetical protein